MNLPNLPTDNLYKFFAITGLLILLISIGSYITSFNNLNRDIIEFMKKLDLLEIEINYHHDDIIELDKILKTDFYSKLDTSVLNRYEKDTIRNARTSLIKYKYFLNSLPSTDTNLKTFTSLVMESIKNYRMIENKVVEINYYDKRISQNKSLLTGHCILSIIGLIFGIYLTFKGFFNWYFKYQKYQDKLIKKESK